LCNGNHLGSADTGRTVQSGKGLVKLQHMPADGRVLLNQVCLMSGGPDVQCRLHPGNAAAHNHDIRMNVYLTRFERFMIIDPVDGCRCQCFCLSGGLVFILSDPGDLFTNRSHLKMIRIKPGPLACTLKSLLVKSGRAGGHHDPVQAVFPDVFLYHLLPGVRAHKLIVTGHHNIS